MDHVDRLTAMHSSDQEVQSLISTQKQPSCKKRCGLFQNGYCEKGCEIKGGSQEMAVIV